MRVLFAYAVGGYAKEEGNGFVEWVTYEIKDKESEWNKVTIMLAKYAEYANVGGNKTGGYGETKFISKISQ